jgi:pyruvate dehydrogenase E2 component (dihydrolipoamide acetyltransferase)
MSEFKMPSLGADMDAGTLVEWKVKPGDSVKRGDIVAVVETAKGVVEVEVFDTGIVDEIFFQPGQEVPVGKVLATICTAEELAQKKAAPPAPKPVEEVKAEKPAPVEALKPVTPPVVAAPTPVSSTDRVKISPLASKVALELGVPLANIQGTGPGGAISRADVERAAQAMKAAPAPAPAPAPAAVAPAPPEVKPVAPAAPAAPPPEAKPPEPAPEAKKPAMDFQTAMRQAIAAAMSRANRDIPHYYLETHIDMTRPLRWLEEENAKRSIKERLLPVVLLLKATAKALTEVPELNGFWVDGAHQVSDAIHIGFAIALRQGGLVTPAIHDTDMKTLDELREAMNDLIMRTRAGRLRSSELTDATITMTSLGDRGAEKVFGVIYPPQVALVGMGKVFDQPWVENGMIGIRPVLVATLAGDHRATDGHRGGIFLEALNRYLQEVEKL